MIKSKDEFYENDLESLSFDIADPNNIVVVEDFISHSDIDEIYKYCYSINYWESQSPGRHDKVHTAKAMKENSPETSFLMQKYVDKLQQEIEFKFGRPVEPAFPGIRRWDEGDWQGVHADGEDYDGTPNSTYVVDYGSVIYINDNYVGGEIFFPSYGIEFKPKPGTLIFFPSSKYYMHGVRKIKSGVRYTSPHFWVPVKHRKLIEIAKNQQ